MKQLETEILDAMLDGVATLTAVRDADTNAIVDFTWTYVNPAGAETYKRSPAEMIGKRMSEVLPGVLESESFLGLAGVVETGVERRRTRLAYANERVAGYFDSRAWKYGDGIGVAWRDVTEHENAMVALQRADADKAILLKEIHHRVSNNLALISALVKLQARRMTDPNARDALEQTRARVLSIGLVHEQLYRAKDLATVTSQSYLRSLLGTIADANGAAPRGIAIVPAIEPIALAMDQALPFGLVVSELVNNAFKHAFPDGRTGTIRVTVTNRDGTITLVVADDGVGIPDDVELFDHRRLGLELVESLTEQLRATLTIERTPGARFTIAFAPSPL